MRWQGRPRTPPRGYYQDSLRVMCDGAVEIPDARIGQQLLEMGKIQCEKAAWHQHGMAYLLRDEGAKLPIGGCEHREHNLRRRSFKRPHLLPLTTTFHHLSSGQRREVFGERSAHSRTQCLEGSSVRPTKSIHGDNWGQWRTSWKNPTTRVALRKIKEGGAGVQNQARDGTGGGSRLMWDEEQHWLRILVIQYLEAMMVVNSASPTVRMGRWCSGQCRSQRVQLAWQWRLIKAVEMQKGEDWLEEVVLCSSGTIL